jgi:glycerophosphoryl diester phosphodiesterase
VAKLVAAARGLPVGIVSGSCAQLPRESRGRVLVDQRLVDTAHQRGIEVHVWTVNEVDEMHHLLDLGVDGLMTDRPALLKDVLQVRGQWQP